MNLDDLHELFDDKGNDFIRQSKSFCMAPFVHLHVTQSGTVTPCCQAPWDEENAFGNINDASINEIWNGERINSFRLKMKNDNPDPRCKKCYQVEKAGLMSLRKTMNGFYGKYFQRVEDSGMSGRAMDPPVYWDIRFSNLCNLRCRICGPWSSTKWANDFKKLNGTEGPARTDAIKNAAHFFEEVEPLAASIEEIYFAGGEPLMIPEHYRFLELLLKHNNAGVILKYNTNFSVFEFKGEHIFNYWKKFKNVFVYASLDDSGARGELQRKELVWTDVLENRSRMKRDCPHVNFILSPTISVLNVFSVCSFHKEWIAEGHISPEEIWPNILEMPHYYNIRSLPLSKKEAARKVIMAHADWLIEQFGNHHRVKMVADEFRKICTYMYMSNEDEWFKEFLDITHRLDRIRGENTFALIPELLEYGH